MTEPTLDEFLALVQGRRGHFLLESGYHGGLWLDLDGLFADPQRLAPFIRQLGDRLRSHGAEIICGPLLGGALVAQSVALRLETGFCFTRPGPPAGGSGLYRARYVLPAALRSHVQDKRVAVVDDVMSAGSSLRATCDELRSHGAIPVAVGALLVLGQVGERYFSEERRLPVEAAVRDAFEIWPPSECPLCDGGVPLEDLTAKAE